ncbi:hypothetical protein IX307_002953 [Bacteroides pyogenes]|jgi:hypothetical protein|nr:hypothetical protein [Bacteroides pyogenes]MBR8788594.1 hypothetical protein [Bacteroides pyogenes]MBR8809277.1 hypothetical protein [Bacteroides pyogenes]
MIIKVNAYFCSIEMDSVTYQVTETFSNIDISIGNERNFSCSKG